MTFGSFSSSFIGGLILIGLFCWFVFCLRSMGVTSS